MIVNEKCLQLKELAELIEKEKTGNATQLAKKINVSRSKLYEILEDLKMLGIEIAFSRDINSYRYINEMRLKVNTPVEVVSIDEYRTINGGKLIKFNLLPTATICLM